MRGRVKVGVDFGTTCTGVAAGIQTSLQTVIPLRSGGTSEKVETVLTYDVSEEIDPDERSISTLTTQFPGRFEHLNRSNDIAQVRWDQEVENHEDAIRYIKLFLDRSQHVPHFSSAHRVLRHLRLADRTVLQAVTGFLSALHRHIIEQLEVRWGRTIVKHTPIDFVFTVPAIWSDEAKEATRTAAIRAGMGSNLLMISEPEAAAVQALHSIQPNNRVPGNNVLVADCGGYTVDLISYKILKIQPTLKLRESVAGTGGPCGSVFLDEGFQQFIKNKIGASKFDHMLKHKPQAWRGARNHSESYHKRIFKMDKGCKNYSIMFPGMLNDADLGTDEDGMITMTPQEMQGIFDPVIDQAVKLVDDQIALLHARGEILSAIILVGGFGQSPYLYERLRAHITTNHSPSYDSGELQPGDQEIEIMRPAYAWQAVVMDAAKRGLEQTVVQSRVYRQHLGIPTYSPFDERIHAEWQRDWNEVTECFIALDCMSWIIPKDSTVSETRIFTRHFCLEDFEATTEHTVDLYSSQLPEAPKAFVLRHGTLAKHCKLVADLSRLTSGQWKPHRNPSGRRYYALDFEITIKIDSGSMDCELIVDGTSYGSVTKAFDD